MSDTSDSPNGDAAALSGADDDDDDDHHAGAAPGGADPDGTGGATEPAPKRYRRFTSLGAWAGRELEGHNEFLRTQLRAAQNEVTWSVAQRAMEAREADPLRYVRHVQDFTHASGGFPHQRVSIENGRTDAEAEGHINLVVTRKFVSISGRFEVAVDANGSPLRHRDAAAGAPEVEVASENHRVLPVNASLFGSKGITYRVAVVSGGSGEELTLANHPGLDGGEPFLEWSNGDRERECFRIGANESTWTVRFRFPHLSRDRKNRAEWILRFVPADAELATKYPALTMETARFRTGARIRGV
jgi:hypothetical protein